MKTAILVMAYGGPDSLEDIAGYLADIRGYRPTGKKVLKEISHNYESIGGQSPLLEISQQQIATFEKALRSETGMPEDFKLYLGMRHWAPWIADAVKAMREDGITHCQTLVLAPHFSKLSIAKYHAAIDEAQHFLRTRIEFHHLSAYPKLKELTDSLAARIRPDLEAHPEAHVVFSAHSLPVRIVNDGDPYVDQLKQTASAVAEKLGLREEQHSFCFQSAGRSPEPWLGPQLDEYLETLHQEGKNTVISQAVGFLCDHVEILYDMDIQAKAVADKLGMTYLRPPALNDDKHFLSGLARITADAIRHWLPKAKQSA